MPITPYQFLIDSLATKFEGDECLEWPFGKSEAGYGRVYVKADNDQKRKQSKRVTRVLWEYAVGPIPPKHDICHRCDNPPCFRLSHLFPGTRSINVLDCVAKGRFNRPKGERNHNSKLTPDKVAEIRTLCASGHTTRSVALKFGVSHHTVVDVKNFKTWK